MKMRIADIFDERMSFSFEVFPPKADQPMEPLLDVLGKLYGFKPDFISCTYGAGGSNKGRNTEVCGAIKKADVECMTHFTCIGNTKADIKTYLKEYLDMGVENILAMRGDLPAGWEGTRGDFSYANDLISFISKEFPQFCIAAACYPEKHIQSGSMTADIAHLRVKQDSGASFLMSQLCYDVEQYEYWIEQIRAAGIFLPVVMGIMPVLSKNATIRMTLSNGCSIPKDLAELIGKYGDNDADYKKAGIEYTANLIHRYMNAGIEGLHMYALNKYDDVAEILNASGIRTDR